MEQMPKAVAEAIGSVMSRVRHVEKKGRNQFHNYNFARVEDLLFQVQPAMAATGLIITQDEVSVSEMCGGALLAVQYAFTLSHVSGVSWASPVRQTGLSAVRTRNGHIDDKAFNKAHTAARKYFLLGLLQVPAGDLPDADADGDVQAAAASAPKALPKPADKLAPRPSAARVAKADAPSMTPAPDGDAPTADTLLGGIPHNEGLRSIVKRLNAATKDVVAGRRGETVETLNAAFRSWERWLREVHPLLTPGDQAKIASALDHYGKAANKLDAAVAAKAKAKAKAMPAHDPETGEIMEYEQAEAAS